MKCKKCQQASQNMWSGQMFTEWACKICGRTFIHHNTATPKACVLCSKQYKICEECGEPVNE